jgi:predicted transposase YbfD/YdcC
VQWVLDGTFREDDSRVRLGNAPQNFAVLRHIALNLLGSWPLCVKPVPIALISSAV